jgi:hypothetical protein
MLDPAASPEDPRTSQKPIVRVGTAPSARKTTAASGAAQPAAPAAKASSSVYEKYP